MFKKIWNDPVGSKVISGGILTLCAYLYSLCSDETFGAIISKIWNYNIGLGWTIVVITILLTLREFWNKKVNSPNKVTSDPKKIHAKQIKEEFRKAKTKILFKDNILVRFTTWFSPGSDLPFIADEVAYCNLHSIPMRMNHFGCPESNCKNNNYKIDMRSTKHTIESILIDEWEKMNSH